MQCKICGHEAEHSVYQVPEMMLGKRDQHRYFQCNACQCLQITEVPDDLAAYYPDHYYSYEPPRPAHPLKQTLVRWRDQYAVTGKPLLGQLLHMFMPNDKLATLKPLQLTTDARVLDVGCGAGLLLYALRELSFANLLGIDPFNPDTVRYPNGLVIEPRDIFAEQGQWDVIMFHHSFEHLSEQQATLQQAHHLLSEQGTVLLRVPTVSSYAWQHYGINWVQLDAPRHLFLHSVASIDALAAQTGFQVEQVVYDSNAFQFWGSEQYEKDIPLRSEQSWAENRANGLFSDKQIRQYERRAHELNAVNQGDQAAFYLKKAPST